MSRELETAVPRIQPGLATMLAAPHQLIAFSLGIGLIRRWPGTWGTVAGFATFAALQPVPPAWRAAVYLLLLLAAVWACQKTGDDLASPDHNAMVIDETLAMSLVLEFVSPGLLVWVSSFLLFRLFDVLKPWPVHLADRNWQGGLFVVLDDVLAAVYAVLVTRYVITPLLP